MANMHHNCCIVTQELLFLTISKVALAKKLKVGADNGWVEKQQLSIAQYRMQVSKHFYVLKKVQFEEKRKCLMHPKFDLTLSSFVNRVSTKKKYIF